MKMAILVLVAVGIVCAPVLGQSLNIDYGSAAGTPPAEYAAAGLPGVWNTLTADPGVLQPLVGLNGQTIEAMVSHDLVSPVGVYDPDTSGFDEDLLDDGLPGVGDVAITVCFEGLADGFYEVTTYAWTPATPADSTLVIVNEDYNDGLIGGGSWPGDFQEGVTHVVHEVEVTDGAMTLTMVGGYWGAMGFLNGIQLRETQGGGGSICSLPADVGPCDGVCPRYYYDVCTAECEPFDYGCCEGNANNFMTLEECEAACPPEDDICFLPADVGPCEGLCQRLFYNVCTGACEQFTYGCCEGNANNFLTMEDCQAACPIANECLQADLDNDGAVGAADLAILLGDWGPCPPPCEPEGEPPMCTASCAPGMHAAVCPADFGAGNCRVDPLDLAILLSVWGPCD